VQSAVSVFASSNTISKSNTTIFLAGCLNHIYLMPISPASRSLSDGIEYTHNISLADDLINVLTSTSPSRYHSVSFQTSLSSASSQYSSAGSPLTIAEMVSVWYSSERGELVGNLCSTHLQCDVVCFDELLTSPKREYADQSYLFNCLILGAFILFVLVLLSTTLSLSLDALHWTAYISTQIQPMDSGDLSHSASLFQLYCALSNAIKVERERYFAEEMSHHSGSGNGNGNEWGMVFKTHDDQCDVEAIREALYEKYGKNTFIKHMAVSESNENNK
jgi:hypothetical protein